MITYRCVKSLSNDDVIAIGLDESQANAPYLDTGVWCDFTFNEIPTGSAELFEAANQIQQTTGVWPNLLKVVDNQLVLKTVAELG